MNKDVIYIDVDDDITAIIGKIKKANEKIVALVPPKRTGALQSAVNLRLLARMAKNDKKQLVLITHNPALVALAANAQLPVAKNLQSKPEIAEIPAIIVDDDDDIIDGGTLPVGDHANTVAVHDGTRQRESGAQASPRGTRNDAVEDIDLSIDDDAMSLGARTPGQASTATVPVMRQSPQAARGRAGKNAGKNGAKIPNFDTFRKKLFFGISGGVIAVGVLIWMFVFAPAATVVITASTEPHPINASVKLGGTLATDYKAGVVSSTTQTDKVDEVVEFEATGEKDVGEKASGTMKLTRTSVSSTPLTVPAGTSFSAAGVTFVSTETATLAGTGIGPGGIVQDTATVEVVATNAGEQYNVSARAYQSSVGGFTAQGSAMEGGTTKIAKVVSADDIERAHGQLIGKTTDAQKKALTKKFTNGEIVIASSFTVDRGEATSTPAVDEEVAGGKAKLTVPTTYTLHAVPKAELESFLKSSLSSKIDAATQKMYSTGVDTATLSAFRKEGDVMTVTINATAEVGPKINEERIKEQIMGKRYGEVQQSLEAIDGIKEVNTKFSFFWVRTVPKNVDKITIEFKVEDE